MRTFMSGFTLSLAVVVLFECGNADAQKKKKEEAPPPRREDVPKLLASLKKSPSAKERAFAADQIGRLGQIQASAVKDCIEPLLLALKKDTDSDVRRASAEALGKIAPDPEMYETIPALTEALKDKSLDVGLAAVTALGRYGADARPALPALREFQKTKATDKKLGQIVTAAIKEISGAKKKGG
jgi:HEAT repeat protein